MKLIDELKLIFRCPRDIHRVIMIAPLGGMLSHGVHLYSKSGPLPLTKDEVMSVTLAAVLYSMITLWVVFSNAIHFRLVGRFLFMAGYGAFAHRMILGVGRFTGISAFELVFSLTCMTVVAFFVGTGFSINEAKDKFNELTAKRPETKNSNVVSIPEREQSAG